MITKEEFVKMLDERGMSSLPLFKDGKYLGNLKKDMSYEKGEVWEFKSTDYAVRCALENGEMIFRVIDELRSNEVVKRIAVEKVEQDTWMYADEDGVERHHVYPRKKTTTREYEWEGTNDKLCERMYSTNNSLRYCNGHSYRWKEDDDNFMQSCWRVIISRKREFDLYYPGIVD